MFDMWLVAMCNMSHSYRQIAFYPPPRRFRRRPVDAECRAAAQNGGMPISFHVQGSFGRIEGYFCRMYGSFSQI